MIGFRSSSQLERQVESPRPRHGEYEYEVVRSGRFVRLSILSDDWLLLGFALFSLLCFLGGYYWRSSP